MWGLGEEGKVESPLLLPQPVSRGKHAAAGCFSDWPAACTLVFWRRSNCKVCDRIRPSDRITGIYGGRGYPNMESTFRFHSAAAFIGEVPFTLLRRRPRSFRVTRDIPLHPPAPHRALDKIRDRKDKLVGSLFLHKIEGLLRGERGCAGAW